MNIIQLILTLYIIEPKGDSYIYACMVMHLFLYAHYTHTNAHVCIHTHTHTHTQAHAAGPEYAAGVVSQNYYHYIYYC